MEKIVQVQSENQSGGLNVGEINNHIKINQKGFKKKGLWSKYWFKWLLGILATIIAGVVIYYLTNQNMNSQIFNVSSINQSGGLTVGQMNVGKQDRKLSIETTDLIQKVLPKDLNEFINIYRVSQDSESYRLAEQVKNYLVSLGYINTTIPQSMIFFNQEDLNKFTGDVNIYDDKELKYIVIGGQK